MSKSTIESGLKRIAASKPYREALGLPDEVTEEYTLLAQGEYNINYIFAHPITGKKLVLRVNCGSQMHLENQITYEYRALELLERSGRTPAVYYVDDTKQFINNGVLVMEYLPGHSLIYEKEMDKALAVLADIHSVNIEPQNKGGETVSISGTTLLAPREPLKAILEECEQMAAKFFDYEQADIMIKQKIRKLLDYGWKRLDRKTGVSPYNCIINTELNSTNFLINGPGEQSYLIDWEKPLFGDPAQDLGHFLAPTTTFWKTDTIFTPQEIDYYIDEYIDAVAGRYNTAELKERTHDFVPITCLRGVTWCAMAWVEYRQPGRDITNESTARKLEQYIDPEFLDRIEELIEA